MVIVPIALMIVVPSDGFDSVTKKVRSFVSKLLFRIGMVIVLLSVASLASNVIVPEVAV